MQLRRTQMAALCLPVVEEDEGNLKAIEDGVKESGEKISEDFEGRDSLLTWKFQTVSRSMKIQLSSTMLL